MPETVIKVRKLCTSFGSQIVHDHLNLDIYRDEILVIIGNSGSGKSVLIRSIVGLHTPNSGTIEVLGHHLKSLDYEQRKIMNKKWGFLFQEGALWSNLTVLQNVQLPLKELYHLSNADSRELAFLKLKLVGFSENNAYKYPAELSGGMAKRAAIARALAVDPEILFLDEPTSGLDPILAGEFDQLLIDLYQNLKLTIVMITHDLSSIQATASRIGFLEDKKIVTGTLKDMMKSNIPSIQQYFHSPRAEEIFLGSNIHR